jgi:hypothetical protein
MTKLCLDVPGRLPGALDAAGRLDEPVLAAGFLGQGHTPSLAAMVTGWALVQLVRGRRTKALPRQFVLAVTASEVVAFAASGGNGGEHGGPYRVRVGDEAGRWPRAEVAVEDVAERALGATDLTLVLAGERLPAQRGKGGADPNTDLLLAVLAGAASPTEPPADAGEPGRRRPDVLDLAGLAG